MSDLQGEHTELLQRSLVLLGLGDGLSGGLRVRDLGLQSENPAVTLRSRCLEVEIGMGPLLEDELGGTNRNNVRNVGQLDDTMGELVALVLGVEQQTLSGLSGESGSGLRVLLLLKVRLQLILRDGIVLEVKESLLLEETARLLVRNNHTTLKSFGVG